MPSFPYLLHAGPNGDLREDRRLAAVDYFLRPLQQEDLIPLPDGSSLSLLPEREAVGLDENANPVSIPSRRGWALSALLPIGYTRTSLPGFRKLPEHKPLPLFGYTAVAGYQGRVYAAAIQTDDPHRWSAPPGRKPLETLVEQRLSAEPDNRLLRQLGKCALEYECRTAQNVFHRRWEGAIPSSPGCTARCVGCISLQEEPGMVSPQDRLTFTPSVQEIVDVAAPHLEHAPDSIISFGQGCEGEPLLEGARLAEAIRAIRLRTDQGVININTNASKPQAFEALCQAGLNGVRASIFSARPEYYNAYYRPIGYGVDEISECLRIADRHGVYGTINLLAFPGFTDTLDEFEAMAIFLREARVKMVQLRNLNIDPDVLLAKLPPFRRGALGMRGYIEALRREIPHLEIGNFSRPRGRRSV